jgi:hypothetical protein
MVSYSFIANWSFYRTAFARYGRQKPNRYRMTAVVIAIGAGLLLAWAYGRASGALWAPISESALIGGFFGGAGTYAANRYLLPRRIKRSPDYGATITVRLDDEGLHGSEPHAQASLGWAAFTRVVRFTDGFLFLRGNVIRWLPDSALTNATPEEALAFVRYKTEVSIFG